jgi:hypothetical protein
MAVWCWYDGSDFHGYQGQGGLRTVQSELMAAFSLAGLLRTGRCSAPALERAASAWERALPCCEEPAGLHLALARLYEHRLRDAHAAGRHAMLARPVEEPHSHARRVARLAKKRQLVLSVR